MLVAPGPPHGEAAEDEHADEGKDLEPVRAAVPVDGEIGDGEERGAVEDDTGARRPLRDVLPALARLDGLPSFVEDNR